MRSADAPLDPDGARVTLDLFPVQEAPPVTATPGAPAPGAPNAPVAPNAPLAPLAPNAPTAKTIVLDPGHGGDELGARGPKGALEKAVALYERHGFKEYKADHKSCRCDRTYFLDI